MSKSNMKFKLYRYEVGIDYINLTLFMSFATLFVAQTFHAPSIIYFLIDVPIMVMMLKNFKKIFAVLSWKSFISIPLTLILIFIFMLIGSVANNVPLGNTLYGIYKYYRGFLFFFSTLALVDSSSEKRTFSLLKVIFWINFVLTIVEFFFGGINQDLLGGIFGPVVGVNQYTNLYFVIISVFCIEIVINRDTDCKKFRQALIISTCMFVTAAFAEIKYFFAEFLVLLLVAYLCLPKKWNSIFGIILIIVGIVVFYNILIHIFPEFTNLVNELKKGGLTRLIDLQRHYSTDNDIGRAVIFTYSNQYLLSNKKNQLIGMGVGNVTSSGIVNNNFWLKNQMTHYDQFYTSYLYNEQGMIGFILYCLIYLEIFIIGLRALLKSKKRKYGTMLIMLVCGCVMVFVYNMAMYSQLCFIAFWALAVMVKKCIQGEEKERI